MNEELTKAELLGMVAKQMETIYYLQTVITESLAAIDNGLPDLGWRKLLAAKERIQCSDPIND